MSELVVTILAAGEGKRMNSNIPKVLHLFHNKPMLVNVIEASMTLQPKRIIVITGKYDELIKSTLSKYINIENIQFVIQKQPLGTGDAIKSCLPLYNDNEKILILNGDMPNITKELLKKFIDRNDPFVVLVAKLANPTGYGRIVYNNNIFVEIIEEKDCTELQRIIDIVNSGLYYIDSEILQQYIPMITNENKQKEYYLTDIVNLANQNMSIKTFLINENENKYIQGVNTQEELRLLEML
uniref:UDP-N-acetylglucosamine diphosphorylase n=1 Tax=viral metagenome TaxID=1070528 RepID=A0A6C0DCH9_9ZZZZ